ncbi:MAG: zinc-dependent alcohol dehydrogenase family protein [Sphingorhabdus sp.]
MANDYLVMQCDGPGQLLHPGSRTIPTPGDDEILLEVAACGVCRTDLHVIDGEIPAFYPVIPGHEVVGHIRQLGNAVKGLSPGARVGVPWLGHTCGTCDYCRSQKENLCDRPAFTGCTRDGGYAQYILADWRYCFPIPERFTDAQAAPLLCAGLIGWRAYRMAGAGVRLGLYGFGSAAHILAQIAVWQGRQVYAFTRPGDDQGQAFARQLGCAWAGNSDTLPPDLLDAAIIFAPDGAIVPSALKAVRKGGRVVCAGIHMSNIPSFPYADLWGERSICSVANLTRNDGLEFLAVADKSGICPTVETAPLAKANEALLRLRNGAVQGAMVLIA